MATDLERLVVTLNADIKKFERSFNKAVGVTNNTANRIERRTSQMNKRLETQFGALGGAATKAFALIGGAAGAKSLLDSATRIENALKVAGLSGEALTAVYDRLYQSAQRNAAPLETLVTLYGRAALVQNELGISTEELLGFTNNVAVALRVAGTDAQTASGALLQLSQALGSGTVRAEEFNSILEGALPIAQAAAAGLKEAGGSVARLRQLVVEGKVSSEAFFRAFEAGSPILEQKVAGATLTLDQRMTNLKTSLIDAAKRFNESSEASNTFGRAIDQLSSFIDSLNFDSIISQLNSIATAFKKAEDASRNAGFAFAEATGLDAVGEFLTGGAAHKSYLGGALTITSSKALRKRIEQAHDGTAAQVDESVLQMLKDRYDGKIPVVEEVKPTGENKPSFVPVSLNDFAPPGGKAETSGRAGRVKEKRPDEYQREIHSIRERTAAIQAETAALNTLDPTLEDYGYTLEKVRAEQDLLNAAQKAGVAITPELRKEIAATAEQWALANVEANKLAESQDKIRQRAEEWRDTQKDALRGIVDDLIQGKSAADAFANALQKIGNKLLDMAFDDLFTGLFKSGGGGGGGIFGQIGKLFGFANGGYTGSGPRNQPKGIVHAGEVVWSQQDIARAGGVSAVEALRNGTAISPVAMTAPSMPSLKSGGSSSQNVTINFNPKIDATGADAAALGRVEDQLKQMKQELPATVIQTVRKAQNQNVKLG